MEIRIIDGRRATDRAGAAELGDVSIKTINLRASPKHRDRYGFPAPLTTEGRREWYPIDGDDGLEAHFRDRQQQRAEAAAAATTTPHGAPDWLYDGDPDDRLPATDFYRAANLTRGAWNRYVQDSKRDWAAGRDGYLPKPVDEEPAPVKGKIYIFRRWDVIDFLNNRSGKGAGAGRKGGGRPGITDAIATVRANPGIGPDALADALDINLASALYLLRKARERLAAEAQ
ncbi:hypothetical protein [Dactylosporangium darangshiense]|uniref:Uncharacterized protein n=1 Tax=Dactylosporangium darangshiense TaxID=579108 RepID=A0ABP8DHY8_9ACTN